MTHSPGRDSERTYLLERQYADAANLDARIQLHARFSTNHGWCDWMFDHFRLPSHGRLLEIGCGSGRLWRDVSERIPTAWELMLTDLSPGMLEAARENLRDVGRSIRFQVADAQELPFAEDAFDAVIANHMLYHVPDRHGAFAEIKRVLRPRGQLYAATNGEGHLRELDDALEQLGIRSGFGVAGHSFTLESGESQLSEWFDWVTLDRYDDALEVTEIEPLVAYVRSMRSGLEADAAHLEAFRAWAAAELAANGAIHITKSSGLFTAS